MVCYSALEMLIILYKDIAAAAKTPIVLNFSLCNVCNPKIWSQESPGDKTDSFRI